MKKTISILLCMMFILSAGALAGCKKKPGPSVVNYGDVKYVEYNDGSAVTFQYLSCYGFASDEGMAFVANTPDDKGVLSYEFYDSFKDYSAESYRIPSRKYSEIAAYSDEEAQDYLKIALGLVDSQNIEYTIDRYEFEKAEKHVRLYMEVTAEYRSSGEIQKMWIEKYVINNERVYTINAFIPIDAVNKYGPAFKDVTFDLESALTPTVGD
ncbi:MAG: hypothetical protein IJM18_03150 [Clostridia bacterium]|nr:hypothetical protein [Clostridia bacterium]